jgi:succinate dehydrogenase/fumarate reductase flavoprotein subunit
MSSEFVGDISCDVVVVGYGGAGATAAIEGHDAGADVMILEGASEGGGNTRAAGGSIRVVHDPAEMRAHIEALSGGATDYESIDSHVRNLAELPEWIKSHGGKIEVEDKGTDGDFVPSPHFSPRDYAGSPFPDVVGAKGIAGKYRWTAVEGHSRGEAAFRFLESNIRSRNIDVRTGYRVRSLARSTAGRVSGLVADYQGEPVRVRAERGVVLACGGFEWDPTLQRDYLGQALPSSAPPHRNTGDGVRMAQSIGADLWHMTAAVLQFGLVVPQYEASFPIAISERGFIFVDRNGERFCDETRIDSHDGGILLEDRDRRSMQYRRLPSFLIFDEQTRCSGPIVSRARGFNRGAGWTDDNGTAIENGWIKTAATISELATKLGLPRDDLARTVSAYNRTIGSDPFGRAAAVSQPIACGPFYGTTMWPCIINTQGGPRRSADGHILDPWRNPIDGLFGAGELGSIWTNAYPGGGNFGEALASGRVAGRSAARSGVANAS